MQWLGTSCSVPSSSMSHMPQTSQHIVLQPELSTAAVCSACAAAGHLPSCLRLAGLPICCSPGQRCLLSKVSLLPQSHRRAAHSCQHISSEAAKTEDRSRGATCGLPTYAEKGLGQAARWPSLSRQSRELLVTLLGGFLLSLHSIGRPPPASLQFLPLRL